MRLLDKRQYLQLMVQPPEEIVPATDAVARVLEYATEVWSALELKQRVLRTKDVALVFRHGDIRLFHVLAYPRRQPETFVIIVVDRNDTVEGHLLIDLGADDAPPYFECLAVDFAGVPERADIESIIPQIDPDDDNPFAVLTLGEGTYMQTLRTDDGFVLEHQLVNTSSHYEVANPVSAEQVVAAMLSYAFGDNEWLDEFTWQLQEFE